MKPRVIEKIKCVKCKLAFAMEEGHGLNFGWFEYMWLGLCKSCIDDGALDFLGEYEMAAALDRLEGWGYMVTERESIHLLHMVKSGMSKSD